MASKCPFSAILISLGIVFAFLSVLVYFTLPSAKLDPPEFGSGWWGKGDGTEEADDTKIHKATIAIPDSVLEDLQQRLSNTRFFSPLEDVQWQYGTNANYMRDLVDYWRKKFDWRRQEALLNSVPNYHTHIEGLKIHFWHLKPELREGQKRVTLLFIHGWPGSYYEFYKVIQILKSASQSGDYAYEIICPAIPGYGFSEAPHRPGFDLTDSARIFAKLMARLGHDKYYVQGGDWGSGIAHTMAVIDQSHVRGLHRNLITASAPYGVWSYILGYFTLPTTEHNKIFPLMDFVFYLLRESGYYHLQSTRPDTIGLGLTDSPAGLAAYIIEKFSVWSGCQTNESFLCLESHFTRDELLTNVMIYWVTNSITSSMRFYKENSDSNNVKKSHGFPVDVPTALAEFPHEIFNSPKPWLSSTFRNIVQHNRYPSGGHFAAFEEPELLAQDVMDFVGKVETITGTSKTEL